MMLWTAAGVVTLWVIQLGYVAFRFGRLDADVQNLKGEVSELRRDVRANCGQAASAHTEAGAA